MSASDPLTLPVVTIDPTFPSVIEDVHSGIVPFEKFWVSCYKTSHPSVHAKIQAELDERNRDLVLLKSIEGDVAMTRGRDGTYLVSCDPLGIEPTPVVLPVQEYRDPERSNPQRPQRITAFDLSPDSTRFATGFLDGSVFLYPVSSLPPSPTSHTGPPIRPAQVITPPPSARPTARPHLSTVTRLQFFPSSRVLLTAGADFSLSILPADLPEPPSSSSTSAGSSIRLTPARTLRGHTRSVTATAILGAGRNVLSASLDGTLKLWDVPSSGVIASLYATHAQPILSAALGPSSSSSSPSSPSSSSYAPPEESQEPPDAPDAHAPTPAPAPDPREVPETHTSTVFVGLQDGTWELFDLRAKRSVFRSSTSLSLSLTRTTTQTQLQTQTQTKTQTQGGISALAYDERHHLLATGSTRGVVAVYDTRVLGGSEAVTAFARGWGGGGNNTGGGAGGAGAGVEDLAFVGDLRALDGDEGQAVVGLVVATTDGLPYIAGVVPEGPGMKAELGGGDCDPVRCVRVHGVRGRREGREGWDVWCAGDDAVVRRWRV